MAEKRIDEATRTETVGHEWDGIEELNTPLPRWWLWTFYATIVFAIGYVVAYPAWPMIERGTEGMLGWTSRGQLAEETAAAEAKRASVLEAIAATPITQLPDNAELLRAAVAGGSAAFKVNCVQCHGSGAAGGAGYPNLNDDDWLWGGDIEAIRTTLVHGIRQPGDDQTRASVMPAFGRDKMLTSAQISTLADQVLSFSGKGKATAAGAALYQDNCAACHGPEGKGMREFGAPNLADAIWLYGGTKAEIAQQIHNPRMGVMPSWASRLDPVTIDMLAAYVHSLGGGETLDAAATDSSGTAARVATEAANGNQ